MTARNVRTSAGLGVHARSVAAAAIDGMTGELVQARLTPSQEHILSWIVERAGAKCDCRTPKKPGPALDRSPPSWANSSTTT